MNPQVTWQLVGAIGATGLKLQSSTGAMMERISSGENLIGYNILGLYAFAKAKKDLSIGYVYPKDYTLVVSRLVTISKKAKNPNAAKLWVDYLLSKRGQTLLVNQADLFSIRADVEGETSMAGSHEASWAIRSSRFRSVRACSSISTSRSAFEFLKQWQQAIKRSIFT